MNQKCCKCAPVEFCQFWFLRSVHILCLKKKRKEMYGVNSGKALIHSPPPSSPPSPSSPRHRHRHTPYRALSSAGVLEERYMKDILDPQFLSNITADQLNEWKDKHNKTVNQSIQEYAVEYVGKPIHNFLRQVGSP